MGHRECRRVPLDFDWPLKKTWAGYLPPDWRECPSEDCDYGSKVVASWLEKITHLILMLGSDDSDRQRGRPMHPWLQELPLHPDKRPASNAAELTGGLARRSPDGRMGHDAIDRWRATRAIIKAAGLPEDWGTCPVCKGHAIHPDDIEASEAWEGTEPPTGDGWQLWETTSEGSPISPVFATANELANWCAGNATWFADMKWTSTQWLASFTRGTTDIDSLLVVSSPKDPA